MLATMGQAFPPVYLASALALAAKPVLNLSKAPAVVNYGDYCEIVLEPAQQKEIADFVLRQLAREPGAVRVIGLGGVVLRILAQKYWGWITGGLASAFTLGRFTKTK